MSEEDKDPPSRCDTALSPTNMLESPPFALTQSSSPAFIHLPNIISSDLKARRTALTSYRDLKKQLMDSGVTYHRQLFLRNMAAKSKFSMEHHALFQLMNNIANDLLMEELEVALWELYLDQMTARDLNYGEFALLWLSAYAAKMYFSTDARMFDTVCGGQVKGFTRLSEEWRRQTTMVTEVSLIELNSMVSALSKPRTCPARNQGRDYNCLVNELLTVPSDGQTKREQAIIEKEEDSGNLSS